MERPVSTDDFSRSAFRGKTKSQVIIGGRLVPRLTLIIRRRQDEAKEAAARALSTGDARSPAAGIPPRHANELVCRVRPAETATHRYPI